MNEMRKLIEASAQLFAEQNKRPGAYESSLTASDVAHLVRLKTTDSVETLSKLKASFDQLKKALSLYDNALSQFHAVYEPQSIDLDDTSGNAYEDLAKIEAELRSAGVIDG